MATETQVLPVNYSELPPKLLLTRLRRTLINEPRLAVAALANNLPAERQTEFRMPSPTDLPFVEVIIASPDGRHHYRVTYFARSTRHPIKGVWETHPGNKIIIEEGKIETTGRKITPIGTTWDEWQAASLENKYSWERIGDMDPTGRTREKIFRSSNEVTYENNQLTSGDASIVSRAVEALENAFQTTGHQIETLNLIEKITWGTEVEPEKPKPPSRGGKRVRVPQATRQFAPTTIPIRS